MVSEDEVMRVEVEELRRSAHITLADSVEEPALARRHGLSSSGLQDDAGTELMEVITHTAHRWVVE